MAEQEDIIRNIDQNNLATVNLELVRLWQKKRVALLGHFTRRKNALIRLMISTMFGSEDPDQADNFDYSTTTKEQLHKSKEELDQSYEKLGRLYDRIHELNPENAEHANTKHYKTTINVTETAYENIQITYGTLKYKLIQHQNQNQPQVPEAQFKPVQALKPNTDLSFDHNPTELENFIQQFTAYFNASKMERLPIPEAQAFLRQGVATPIWTSIQDEVSDEIPVLENPLRRHEVSCMSLIRRQFQIKYPLITRRYEFMTYERAGNMTFTDFFSNLKNMAQAAQMETMTQNDYLIYRIICGINQKEATDKLLSIPQDNFNLEEIKRIAESMEAAKNYKEAITPKAKPAERSYHTKTNYQRAKQQEWTEKYAPKQENNDTNNEKKKHFDRLKKEKLCFRCGESFQNNDHKQGCPKRNATCRSCGKPGHIQAVCATPKTTRQNTRHTTSYTITKEDEQTTDSDSE